MYVYMNVCYNYFHLSNYLYINICVGVCIYVCLCIIVWVCTCVTILCVGVNFPFLSLCFVACYNDSDSFVWSELGNKSFGFVPVMDPIHKWFEDRTIGWSGGSYRFLQWSQMAIRIQNHVISCECLFIGLFQFQCLILLFHANVCIIMHYSVHDHAHFIDILTCVVIFWNWNVFGRTWC